MCKRHSATSVDKAKRLTGASQKVRFSILLRWSRRLTSFAAFIPSGIRHSDYAFAGRTTKFPVIRDRRAHFFP